MTSSIPVDEEEAAEGGSGRGDAGSASPTSASAVRPAQWSGDGEERNERD